MPEDDGSAQTAIPNPGDETGQRLRGVDGVDEDSFRSREQPGGFCRRLGRAAVALAELVAVDYTPLLAHMDVASAPAVSSRSFRYGDPEAAFASAAHRVEATFHFPRYSSTPIECYAVLADWNEAEREANEQSVATGSPLVQVDQHRGRGRGGDPGAEPMQAQPNVEGSERQEPLAQESGSSRTEDSEKRRPRQAAFVRSS